MFKISAAEKELALLRDSYMQALKERRWGPEGLAENERLRKLLTAIHESPLWEAYEFKQAINEKIAALFPGDADTYLSLVEELVQGLDGPTATRLGAAVKSFLLRAYGVASDKEVAEARAKTTAVRYNALLSTGLPEAVAAQIVVAEASKPFPTLFDPRKK